MAKQEYEFTLVFSGVQKLSDEVLNAFYEAGCDDSLIGIRGGVGFADFCREAHSLREALLSAIRDVEGAGVGAKVEHIEPDELVTMSEIARRLHLTREGVRKWIAQLRGPGDFPPPVGSLKQRSPIWRWSDVIQWHGRIQGVAKKGVARKVNSLSHLETEIATVNAALDLRRRLPFEEAVELLQEVSAMGL